MALDPVLPFAGPPPVGVDASAPGFGGHPGTYGESAGQAGAANRLWRPRVISPVWQVVAALVVVAGIVGMVFGLLGRGGVPDDGRPTAGGGPTAGGDIQVGAAGNNPARKQVVALDQLLSGSTKDRGAVVNAVVSLKNCRKRAKSATTLRQAAASRSALVTKLGKVEMSEVDGGKQLKRTLRQAWQKSADADRAFARWGDQITKKDCRDGKPKKTKVYRRAVDASGAASRAKKDFVAQWNTLADRYGLDRRKPSEI